MANKKNKKKKPMPKQRRAVAVDALLRRAEFMKDRRLRRKNRQSWKKEIQEEDLNI